MTKFGEANAKSLMFCDGVQYERQSGDLRGGESMRSVAYGRPRQAGQMKNSK